MIALITQGEGYHNFHHSFPFDYRNGIRWFDYDPTKWFIWAGSQVGLVTGMKQVGERMIDKCRVKVLQRRIGDEWGVKSVSEIPEMSMQQFKAEATAGKLTMIDGYVVSLDALDHPGGDKVLEKYVGRDATKAFFGGLNWHSQAARIWMGSRRIGFIPEGEVGHYDTLDQ